MVMQAYVIVGLHECRLGVLTANLTEVVGLNQLWMADSWSDQIRL